MQFISMKLYGLLKARLCGRLGGTSHPATGTRDPATGERTLRCAPERLVADRRADGTITLPFGGFGPVIGQTADGLSLAVWLCCGLGLRR